MFFTQLRGRSVLFVGVIAALGIVGVQMALAVPPPPPKFWEFQVANNLGVAVDDIHIKLLAGQDTGTWSTSYQVASPMEEYGFFLKKLQPGRSHVFSIPTLFDVARIEVVATCGGHNLSVSPLPIQANQGDYDLTDPGVAEWAGFTKYAPNGSTVPFGLTFSTVSGVNQAYLTGLSRWGGADQQKSATATFP